MTAEDSLKQTALHDLHVSLGAKMVPFTGYSMPLQYPSGILTEHKHTRKLAGLFDVSHMGQAWLSGDNVLAAIEALVPSDIQALNAGQARYSTLLAEDGGILDDLIITRPGFGDDKLFIVVNAGCKYDDFAHIRAKLPGYRLDYLGDERALLALQGPCAAAVIAQYCSEAANLNFMHAASATIKGISCLISRSGYTGEDGFEISVDPQYAVDIARLLLKDDRVMPIGLGARDSLRLEAGLCLYGHDIDKTTDPIEAGLAWIINKRRRDVGGFPGQNRIVTAINNGAARKRVGLYLEGKAIAREGSVIMDLHGNAIGAVTSGGYSPSLERAIAMGYVTAEHMKIGSKVQLLLRGQYIAAEVVKMPFYRPAL